MTNEMADVANLFFMSAPEEVEQGSHVAKELRSPSPSRLKVAK
jgi:hypothetical protein